jgi:hypothetical protein
VVSAGKPWGKEVLQMMLSYPDELIKKRIGISNGILAPAPPERNPQNDPWDTPAAAMWRSFSPRATMR